MKALPVRLIRAHYATLVNANTGKPDWDDWVAFLFFPAVVLGVCIWRQTRLPVAASVGLTTVCGLLSAFLIGVVLQASQRAMDLADSKEQASQAMTRHADFVRQIAANAGYASLVSFVAAGVFVVAAVTSKDVLLWASSVGLAMTAHLAASLLMVLQRVYALTEGQLNRATTGANVEHLHHHKGRRTNAG